MPRMLPDGTYFAPGIDEYLISMDCSFKDTSKSDYVCIQVWGRSGSRARLLAQTYERMDFPTAQGALLTVCAQWPQARIRLIEDTANGPAIMSSLRGVVGGLIPVTPQGSKEARVHAVSPFAEAGDIELPHPTLSPITGAFVDQCAAFPNGTHDDMVDTFSQAVERLLGQGTGLAGFMARLADQRRAA
jgi:predicted phage terminase large subunit-like protein